jgi:peptidyl-prolyl cis-trans isomerase SurA
MKRLSFYGCLIILTAMTSTLRGQKDDPVLFKVNNVPVHVSEFKYIYSKNGSKADFGRASLEEYLELYTNFKLKVQRAHELRLDTIPSLKQELDGYRKQLADSYLIDREVTDKLIAEAYDRLQKDMDISHIMVACPEFASPEDTLKAYQKINEAREKLAKGAEFGEVAMVYSDDQSKERNRGNVGFVAALFPNGMYALENEVYNLRPGQLSKVVRSAIGYHIAKLNGVRDARGEIEVAHILVRAKPDDSDSQRAKSKIDSAYMAIKAGEPFEAVASRFSEDQLSASKGGYVGFFGINRYERSFEDASFGLKQDDDYTEPFQSSLGWHIVRRLSKKNLDPFNVAKFALQTRVKNDARFELARRSMIQQIRKENHFTENLAVLNKFAAVLDSSFFTFKWKPSEAVNADVLCTIGKDTKLTVEDFENYLARSSRDRLRLSGTMDMAQMVQVLYGSFTEEECLRYEERHLDQKYPEFRSLMREYEEGILLFEATKLEVWDKASQDTVGLLAFFKTIDGKYQWKPRAEVSMYTLKDEAKDKIAEIRTFSADKSPDRVLAKFNESEKPVLSMQSRTFEQGRNEVLDKMKWEVGSLSAIEINKRDNTLNFMKIEKLLPGGAKSLDESRGYVVADYQDFLEKEWVAMLKNKYKVETSKKVFEGLIKK